MQRFKSLLLLFVVIAMAAGCSLQRQKLAWRVKDVVLAQTPIVRLWSPDERVVVTLPTKTLQQMMLAHLRIARSAKIQTELFIVEGDEPNAFAGHEAGQRIIGINLGMVNMIGDDVNEYAALIGHEAAHWAKGHVDSAQLRSTTLNAIGTLVGSGLGMAGVPAAGAITSLGVELIDASFSRDQEREADAQSVEYMSVNGYEPRAALRLHEKMSKAGGGFRLPFLSSHPSNEERIANLKALIEIKEARSRGAVSKASKIE
ncbi:MAG TPA: M48 family metalloprotease [Candidatus Limnocylindrales bacterium]|nr:M48 family metalloprotease [Candidatus Limnocylindrales bacterium]